MRWIVSLALFLVLAGVARAEGPDDQYLNIYNEVMQADSLQRDGQARAAAIKYFEAQTRLQKLKDDFPGWNSDVVNFRLQYLTDKVKTMGDELRAPNAPNTTAVAKMPANAPHPASDQQIAALQEQVRVLTEQKTELENKVKEALSVQPAAVSPVEMAKREEEIVALKKERDLLAVDLEQAKAAKTASADASNSKAAADLAAAKADAADANKKLEAAGHELTALKSAATDAAQGAQERDKLKEELAAAKAEVGDVNKKLEDANRDLTASKAAATDASQITQERDKLKEELATRTKDLADAEAHGDQELITAHAQVKDALSQRDELQKKLDAAVATPVAPAADTAETQQLRARVAALEATAVPYTPEELAVVNQAQSQPAAPLPVMPPTDAPATTAAPAPAAAPATTTPKPHVAHSAKELPAGAGAMMADAMRASQQRDYAGAEAKYQEILHQDENNVYVLAHLADAQFAEGHLEDCGKSVDRALALDPDDPATLYMLGILRYRQEKLDDALNALSRSAQLNSTNAGTQNYLGCVLADKGMRPAAETAFRKALQMDPEYADAHYNLAFVYATEKPPSPTLARWHYKKSRSLGHPENAKLEEILAKE